MRNYSEKELKDAVDNQGVIALWSVIVALMILFGDLTQLTQLIFAVIGMVASSVAVLNHERIKQALKADISPISVALKLTPVVVIVLTGYLILTNLPVLFG